MALKIAGKDTGNVAEVSALNELKIISPGTLNGDGNPSIVGNYSTGIFEADAGTVTGAPTQKQGDISANYRQRVGIDSLQFNEQFNGTALNSTLWSSNLTTFTTSVTGGFLTLNASTLTTANAVARVSSYRGFPAFGSYPLQIEVEAIVSGNASQSNNVIEIGCGFATGVAAPTDGAFFRYKADGLFTCVVCYNSVENVSADLPEPSVMERHHYVVVVGNDYVEFWIDNVLYANIPVANGNGMALLNQNTPVLMRIYNTATPPSVAVQLKVASVSLSIGDMNMTKDWGHTMCGFGGHGSQGQTGGVMGSTALYTNSLAPGAGAVMTNTTAALGVGLGGQFAALPTLAANIDGIISSYQVPASTAAAPSKTLYINGVKIQGAVTTVLVGNATPVIYAHSLAYGHTSLSLATAEGVTTKAPRRIPLGYDSYAAAAAVGTLGLPVIMTFDNPIVVQPGEFVQIVGKNVGVVTTTGVITFLITFDAYWE